MKIYAKNISFKYNADAPFLFNHFNIEIDPSNSPLVILGPSGSGKTTLLKLLGGLLKPCSGEIMTAARTAFMFQEPRLLEWLTVLENIRLPLLKEFDKEESLSIARKFLSYVDLDDKADKYPSQLSGGEAQRVSMARAYAWPSDALFIDEPYQSLDFSLRKDLMDLTLSILKKENKLLAMVSHDPYEAEYLGCSVLELTGILH